MIDRRRDHAGARVYIDPNGFTVRRICKLDSWKMSMWQLKVEYASRWPVGPYTPVEFKNGLLTVKG